MLNHSSHPNAYVWADEDTNTKLPMDSSILECHIQIAALNKRLDQLSNMVQEILTPKQQESVLQLFRS
jgi:hypothetical protein